MFETQPQASNPATALSEAHTGAATVVSCGQSGPQHVEEDEQSYGANSPRAARSQISTAVSFEGAKPAGSAAGADCSVGEDSAHSAADPEDENSSMPAAQAIYRRPFLAHPTASVLSTAVRATSPPPRQPGSPDIHRANSVVSQTEASQRAARAGTPASVYAQGRALPTPNTRSSSPGASHAGEQNSVSGEFEHSARSSRRLPGGIWGARSGRSVHSRAQPTAGSRRQAETASRHASFLAPAGKVDTVQRTRRQPPPTEINSIEAVQLNGSQDGGLAFTSAEGPNSHQQNSVKKDGDSPLLRLGSTLSKRNHHGFPRDQECIDKALLNMQSAAKEVKTVSTAKDTITPALQQQHSAVLGSGVLTAQPGRLHRRKRSEPMAASPSHPQNHSSAGFGRFVTPHSLRIDFPHRHNGQPPTPTGGAQQLSFVADPLRTQSRQFSADEALSGPRPQPAVRQDLEEPAGLLSDVEMTGPSHTHTPPSSPGPLERSGSRLVPPSVAARPAPAVSGGASQHARDASENIQGGSAQAQVIGSVPWGEAAATPAVNSGWNPPRDAEQDAFSEGAAQQANSVLGTLVNEDAISVGNDNDVRSLQPSQQQAIDWPEEQLAKAAEPSQHAFVPLMHSTWGPAVAAASDMAVVGPQASALAQMHQLQEMACEANAAGIQQEAEVGGATVGRAGSLDSINAERLITAQGSTCLPNLTAATLFGQPLLTTAQNAGEQQSLIPQRQQPEGQPPPLPPRHPVLGSSARRQQGGSPRQRGSWPRLDGLLPADSHASTPHRISQNSGGVVSAAQSGGVPAAAMVRTGSEALAGGHDTVVQSQPPSSSELQPLGPQPALTIVMPGGLQGPCNEPDDGAAGPVGKASTAVSNGLKNLNGSADERAASVLTSPSHASSGRPKRDAVKRKRAGNLASNASIP